MLPQQRGVYLRWQWLISPQRNMSTAPMYKRCPAELLTAPKCIQQPLCCIQRGRLRTARSVAPVSWNKFYRGEIDKYMYYVYHDILHKMVMYDIHAGGANYS